MGGTWPSACSYCRKVRRIHTLRSGRYPYAPHTDGGACIQTSCRAAWRGSLARSPPSGREAAFAHAPSKDAPVPPLPRDEPLRDGAVHHGAQSTYGFYPGPCAAVRPADRSDPRLAANSSEPATPAIQTISPFDVTPGSVCRSDLG